MNQLFFFSLNILHLYSPYGTRAHAHTERERERLKYTVRKK